MRDDPRTQQMLDWYDNSARDLPWRTGPAQRRAGQWPNPYHVWLSEIMLQQTTVATVQSYFRKFLSKWSSVQDLAAAPENDVLAAWAGLGYYARARNLVACSKVVVDQFGGEFPKNYNTLLKLPGIGPYTAAAISAIAYDRPETVVDGNVIRVISRLFSVQKPMPAGRCEIEKHAASLTPRERPGDYAQAIMDLGAVICKPRAPDCASCPWQTGCRARATGEQEAFPKKLAKKPKPTRYGYAYLVKRNNGSWLLERRPPKGLLGGMLGWPCSDWGDTPLDTPPVVTQWHNPGLTVRHTFTHFHLELSLRLAVVENTCAPTAGNLVTANKFSPEDFPTVMRKAYDLAQTSAFFRA